MDRKDFLKARIMEGMGKKSGTKPMSDKEKSLAALAHPKDKITHKDVLVGRGVLKKEEVELDEMDKSQPSSSRGAEGLPLGKKAEPIKTDKAKQDALKALQKQYKKVKEEVELEENYRVLATKGIGAERKEDIKVGHGVDYYHPKDGSKHMGKIHSMNDKGYVVRDDKTGEKHKFQYYRRMEEEVEQVNELKKGTLMSYVGKAREKNIKDSAKNRLAGTETSLSTIDKQQAKVSKRSKGIQRAYTRLNKEEVEQIDELKKSTMASYVKKAAASYGRDKQLIGRESPDGTVKNSRPEMKKAVKNRLAGINRAAERLAKEEVEQPK